MKNVISTPPLTMLKEGFFLQIAPDQYLLGRGPLSLSVQPDKDKWSLFHPPFFLP